MPLYVCYKLQPLRNPFKKSSCQSHMDILLQKLVSLGRIFAQYDELVKRQYQKVFIAIDQINNSFQTLIQQMTGLTHFF